MTQAKSLGPRAQVLLDAHVGFEMQQWQGAGSARRIRSEIDSIWAWAEKTPLNALVDMDTVKDAAVRLALDMELPDDFARVIGAIADDLIRLEVNKTTRVQDVVDEALFDEGVSLFVELEALRARLIKRLLDSPVYTALASDVLYQGIKDYIFADSGAIKSIPGVSSLIKGSTSAVSKRLPGLEAQVEKRVRSYIENNTAKTLARSEQLLLESLDEARIRAIAADLWTQMHDAPLSIDELVDAEELQKLVDYGLRVWKELRQTQYLGDLVNEAVGCYFVRYGDRPVTELLAQVGVDRELLRREADTLVPVLVNGLTESGLLEPLIRRRLKAFYGSKAFDNALADGNGE